MAESTTGAKLSTETAFVPKRERNSLIAQEVVEQGVVRLLEEVFKVMF